MAAKKKAKTTRTTLHVKIVGTDLPGASCTVPEGHAYENIHVGVQVGHGADGVAADLVRGDAKSATWAFDVEIDGDGDFFGEHVQGKKGDRFFYLSWGATDAKTQAFTMFRRAKLMLAAVDDAVIAAARESGTLVAALGLTMANGTPLCAAVRPPLVRWRAT